MQEYRSPQDRPHLHCSCLALKKARFCWQICCQKEKRLTGLPVSRFAVRTAVSYFLWCFLAFGAGAVRDTGLTTDSSTGVRPVVSNVAPSGMRVVAEDFVPAVPV